MAAPAPPPLPPLDHQNGVHLYLDLDKAPLPDDYDVDRLFVNIDTSLNNFRAGLYLQRIVVYGDLTTYGGPNSFRKPRRVPTAFFNVVHLKKRLPVCSTSASASCAARYSPVYLPKASLSYERLKEDCAENTNADLLRDRCPYNVLIVTSNVGFISTIASLKTRGFYVHVASLNDAPNELRESGRVKWDWHPMTRTEANSFQLVE